MESPITAPALCLGPLEGRQNGKTTNDLMGWGSKAKDRASWWSTVAERFCLVACRSFPAVPRMSVDPLGLAAIQKLIQ